MIRTDLATIRNLGLMAFNLSYADFRWHLGLDDDDYARGKYEALKNLGRAMAPFSDATLYRLVEAYRS